MSEANTQTERLSLEQALAIASLRGHTMALMPVHNTPAEREHFCTICGRSLWISQPLDIWLGQALRYACGDSRNELVSVADLKRMQGVEPLHD